MSTLGIYASEVAALTGNHQYQPVHEAIVKLWKRNDSDHYHRALAASTQEDADEVVERLIQQSGVDLTAVTTVPQTTVASIQAGIEASGLDPELVPEAVTKAVRKHTEMEAANEDEVKKRIKRTAEEAGLSTSAVCMAMRHVQSKINCGKGTSQEETGLKVYETQFQKVVKKRNAQRYRYVGKGYVIVGKVDGIENEDTVVEHKHRMKRFFSSIPTYERVQVMTYLKLVRLTKATHVQHYRGETRAEAIDWDPTLWDSIRLELEAVARRYHAMLSDPIQQQQLLQP